MNNVRPLVQIIHAHDVATGTRSLDPADAARFARFVRAIAASDAIWRKHPTWFVGSAIGPADREQHDADRLAVVDAIAPREVLGARVIVPAPRDVRTRRSAIVWPTHPLVARSPDARTEVQLYGLDTHDGGIDPDEFARLAHVQALHRTADPMRAIRVVVSHHPIPALFTEHRATRLAHLHLAAHTPHVEPSAGRRDLPHFLSPGSFSRADDPWRGTVSVLRIHAAVGEPGVVVCERLVASCSSATGAWGWCASDTGTSIDEWTVRG